MKINSQISTADQLAELRILVEMYEYDLDNLTQYDVRGILKLANFNGLYDAADFVSSQTGPKITLDWN